MHLLPSEKNETPLTESAIGALLTAFVAGRNERTLRSYSADLRDFQTFTNAPDIGACARLLLGNGPGKANLLALNYKSHLFGRKLQPATINRRLAALRSLLQVARLIGLVTWKLEVQNSKTMAYRDTKGPGKEGFRMLLQSATAQRSKKAIRDVAILRLLYDLALRSGELVRLDLADVDLNAGTVDVLGKGKTEKEKLTLPAPTKECLKKWINLRGNSLGPLFINFDPARKGERLTQTSVYRLIRGLGRKNGIKARPHGLRHTAISEAIALGQANNFGLEEVCDYSRHRSVSALLIYNDRARNVQGQLSHLVANSV